MNSNIINSTSLSNTFLVFLVPITSYLFFFGYNWGYNSYFKLPAYLTTLSINLVLSNLFSLIIFFLSVVFIIFFFNLLNHILKPSINPSKNSKFNKIMERVSFFVFIILFILSIATRQIPLIIIYSTMVIIYVYLMHTIKRAKNFEHKLNSIKTEEASPESIIELKEELDLLEKKSEIPYMKPFILFGMITSLFLIFYVSIFSAGLFHASQQKTFYTINSTDLIINTYNDNYISVPLIKSDNIYYYEAAFKLTPMENTNIQLINMSKLELMPDK